MVLPADRLLHEPVDCQRASACCSRPSGSSATWLRSVPGVNETPRRTSPKRAVSIALKRSLAGRLVAASLSVIMTSRFGSAPWSPPPLTVEVIAQIVAVPSRLTWPVMFSRPSVAGHHGRIVTELVPVGYPGTVDGRPRFSPDWSVWASCHSPAEWLYTHVWRPA